MERNGSLLIVLFFLLFQIGCFQSNNAISSPLIYQKSNFSELQRDKELRVSEKSDNEISLEGCWSNGKGMTIKITENQIIFSHAESGSVTYKIESYKSDSSILLRLLNRQKTFYFQEYVTLKPGVNDFGKQELKEASYLSYEDFLSGKKSGVSAWVKADCNKWFTEKKLR